MQNIPVVKLGLVAVSRDCFPIALSEKRRAAIAEKCGQKKLDFIFEEYSCIIALVSLENISGDSK